jgi:hypothetical protein
MRTRKMRAKISLRASTHYLIEVRDTLSFSNKLNLELYKSDEGAEEEDDER